MLEPGDAGASFDRAILVPDGGTINPALCLPSSSCNFSLVPDVVARKPTYALLPVLLQSIKCRFLFVHLLCSLYQISMLNISKSFYLN